MMKNIYKHYKKILFILISYCLISLPHQVVAEEYWQVLGNTAWVTGDDRLTLDMPSVKHADLQITSDTVADFQWVEMQIPFKLGGTIKGIYLCYLTSSEESFISQIRLAQYLVPPTALVKHDDGTNLFNKEGSCYLSVVDNYKPLGSVNLSLRLNFSNTEDIIHLGALGILFDQ